MPQRGQRLFEARRAVDDDEFRRFQPALDEIVEQRPPGRLALAAHVLDRRARPSGHRRARQAPRASEMEVAFLSSRTRTTVPSRMSRMIGSSVSERGVPGVPIAFRLAPCPADRCPCRPRRRTAHPTPGAPGACWSPKDRRRRSARRRPSCGADRRAEIGSSTRASCHHRPCQPGARDGDPGLAEGSGQRPFAVAVPAADDRRRRIVIAGLAPSIARARQRRVQLFLQHRFDEAAHAGANPVLDRVAPIVEKQNVGGAQPPPSWYPSSWRGLLSSGPTLESFGFSNPETTPTNFHHLRDGTLNSPHRVKAAISPNWPGLTPAHWRATFAPLTLSRMSQICDTLP